MVRSNNPVHSPKRCFVGRVDELHRLRAAARVDSPCRLVHISGPGGIGKSALLDAFLSEAGENDLTVIRFAPREGPAALESIVASAPAADWLLAIDDLLLGDASSQCVRQLLQTPPAGLRCALTVSRHSLPVDWRASADWMGLIEQISLDALDAATVQSFLVARHVPDDVWPCVVATGDGLPLALTLAADRAHDTRRICSLAGQSEVVRAVVDNALDGPNRGHQSRAINVCTLAAQTHQGLLERVLGLDDARELFEWLADQSWTVPAPRGVRPHPALQGPFRDELEWRNPDAFARTRRELMKVYRDALLEPVQNTAALRDLFYLDRFGVGGPLGPVGGEDYFVVQTADYRDTSTIYEASRRLDGEAAGRVTRAWLESEPSRFLVARRPNGAPLGYMHMLPIEHDKRPDPTVDDPVLDAVIDYLAANAPLRRGESAMLMRSWADVEAGQTLTPIASALHMHGLAAILSHPNIVIAMATMQNGDAWMPWVARGIVRRHKQLDIRLDGRGYESFGVDWRRDLRPAWLEQLALADETPRQPSLRVLARSEFDEALRSALKTYAMTGDLRLSPLLESRLVVDRLTPGAGLMERLALLRRLIRSAVGLLEASPRTAAFRDALWYTYIEPVENQRVAASVLQVPFSTYRRHLARGADAVVDALWPGELGEELPGIDARG